MAQTDEKYFATYCRLEHEIGDASCKISSGSVFIGRELSFKREDYVDERGKDRCRGVISNDAGNVVGYLPEICARRVCDLAEDGWIVRIASWALMYNSTDKRYYVEAAVIAYEPQYAEQLNPFVEGCFDRMGNGERPDIRLSPKQFDAALSDPSFYKSLKTVGRPKAKKDEAYYKDSRSAAEKMAIEGSKNNPGCWVGTILFYVALAAIVIAIVRFFFFN